MLKTIYFSQEAISSSPIGQLLLFCSTNHHHKIQLSTYIRMPKMPHYYILKMANATSAEMLDISNIQCS
jgi:hypothetical protein